MSIVQVANARNEQQRLRKKQPSNNKADIVATRNMEGHDIKSWGRGREREEGDDKFKEAEVGEVEIKAPRYNKDGARPWMGLKH